MEPAVLAAADWTQAEAREAGEVATAAVREVKVVMAGTVAVGTPDRHRCKH